MDLEMRERERGKERLYVKLTKRGEIVSRFIVNASHRLQHESHLKFFLH